MTEINKEKGNLILRERIVYILDVWLWGVTRSVRSAEAGGWLSYAQKFI